MTGSAQSGVRARLLRDAVFAVLVLTTTWVVLQNVDAPSAVPIVRPAAALLAGWLLTAAPGRRPALLVIGAVAMVAGHLLAGFGVGLALGYSLSSAVGVCVVVALLVRGARDGEPALLEDGDVSALISAITVGSLVAAVGYGGVALVADVGDWRLALLSAFGAHACALMVVLPLFLRMPSFDALAGPGERLLQALITLGTTVVVFSVESFPPVIFAVMPMFSWHAFRGKLREASLLLMGVGIIGATLTALDLGPVWGFESRYDVSPEVAAAVLQLFLLDCGLILLPLSVMVTQQRIAAASAAAEREKLERLVAQATGTAVILTGPDDRVTMFNPGAEETFGLPAASVIGTRPDSFLDRAELHRHARQLGAEPTFGAICEAAVASDAAERSWFFHRSDGQRRVLRMSLTVVPDERGGVSGHLATADDVTEREAAQAALQQSLDHERAALEQLRDAEQVKSDFVATVSHELRTPLSSILGYLEILGDGLRGELTEPQRELVGRVQRNGKRLQVLVEDLLTLSEIDSSALESDAVPTDLRMAVAGAHDSLSALLESRSLDVVVDVPPQPVVRDADPDQLERMVLNLLSNAVKFTEDGGRIEVRLRADARTATIVVRDTGIGIPEHEQAQLFTRFFRSQVARTNAVQGTGLGLTIVEAIVALHGGTIDVHSVYGEGTTVTVMLPLSDGSAEELDAIA